MHGQTIRTTLAPTSRPRATVSRERPRRMNGDRRQFDPERFAQRVADESSKRDDLIMSSLEMISKTVNGLQEDVRRGNLNDLKTESRFADLEMQIRETREAVNLYATREAEAAAKGGAAGAVAGLSAERIGPVVHKAMTASVGRSNRPQWIAVSAIVALWLTTFVEKAPAVFRATAAFFQGVTELDRDEEPKK